MPIPCYFFAGLIERAGGVFVPVPSWDPEAIERAVTPRSRALVLTNPNNPDGHLPSRAEIDELLALASRHGLTVITDEAYERCIHEGELASAWGAPNVILIRSLGKSLAMPAWRIGFVAGEPRGDRRLPARARVGRDPRQPRRPASRHGRARRPAGLAGRRRGSATAATGTQPTP